ncbi:bifunctional lysine-specific demethylase and histidyl-hydroxylase NO66-like protein [Labeo rohita]|uniref:Bifunctional lysine-specific demethylase and histidyl-hydroxylase n=1 Tax=Labeo rohita TaxID=84645 RepID=A0A498NKK1_LABRO|nr:bifunctional lysine-specific demethylase and histidyl-hydroxylase NO66-like protein [Labeo rohita]
MKQAAANPAANERHNRYFTVPQNNSLRTDIGPRELQLFRVSMVSVTDRNGPAKSPPAKKIKRKENGIQPKNKLNKKKTVKPLKSNMRLSSSDKEKSKAEKECETHNGEGVDSPALDALLMDLTKVNNSRDRANRLFQWLIHPVQDKSFFRDNWEKKPILIQRQNPDFYKGLFSTAEFDQILRNDDVQYGVNLDVTSYTNGKRETHNPPGRALPYTVWDFYELMPASLEIAMEEDVEFRKGLPLDYLQFMGVQNSEKDDPRRSKFIAHVEGLMKNLVSYAPVDAAVDQKARDFLHDCLPPMLSAEEKASSVYGAPARWGDGKALDVTVQLKGQTQIRLVRAGAARLCGDGDTVSLFYTTENSRVYHKEEPKSTEMKTEHIDAMEFLIHSYPKFVSVASLPCETMEAKMSLAELLFEKGVIRTAEPLTAE